MKLKDLKASFPSWEKVESFKALYDPEAIQREFEAEVVSLAASDMTRAELVRDLAWVWVNYHVLHAVFERHVHDREPIDQAHAQYAAGVSEKAKANAKIRHREKAGAKVEIRRIWASGKYDSRDLCAEEECEALGIKFSTARKALRGTPDPSRSAA